MQGAGPSQRDRGCARGSEEIMTLFKLTSALNSQFFANLIWVSTPLPFHEIEIKH